MILEVDDGRRWLVEEGRCTFTDGDVCLILDTNPFFSALERISSELALKYPEISEERLLESIPRRIPTIEIRFGTGDSVAGNRPVWRCLVQGASLRRGRRGRARLRGGRVYPVGPSMPVAGRP